MKRAIAVISLLVAGVWVLPSAIGKTSESAHPSGGDKMRWEAATKLTWADFKAVPDSVSPHKAFTMAVVQDEYDIKKEVITADIHCYFERDKSWVKKKGETPAQLKHEQLHFDIAELVARKMRKDLALYSSKDVPSTQAFIDAVNKKYIQKELDSLNTVYDTDTNFGVTESKQKKWETKIVGELRKYEAYTATRVEIKRVKK